MENRVCWQELILQLKNPFTVAYGSSNTRTAFIVRVQDDACEGIGEGTIPFYYGIPFSAMTDFWDQAALRDEPFPDAVSKIRDWVREDGPAPARAGLDIALHDRLGKLHGLPVWQLLGLSAPRPMTTSYTLSIDSPEAMANMALKIAPYPIIKIKLGAPGQESLDEERLAAVRTVRPDALLRVDANAGWAASDAVELIKRLEKFDLEMVEQPVAKDDFAGMGLVQSATSIPIVADESVCSLADIDRLHKAGVAGVNIKLMKCGGLAPAVEMARRAKDYGMRVMLGCMVETSVGVGAMTHLMGLADWVDLDTPLLISNDPFVGLRYDENALLTPPVGVGIGIE